MMPIKLHVYRVKFNHHSLLSIKYIQNGYIKYAVFEKKYLAADGTNGYNNSFNLGKRQYQSRLVMYVKSQHDDMEIKTDEVKLVFYTKAVMKNNKHVKEVKGSSKSFSCKDFEYTVCDYNKMSKVIRITSDDYPGQAFVYYQNIPNKLFSIKKLTEYNLSYQLNKKFQNILKKK